MPCPHGQQHSRCKECGGSGICEHGRRRSNCTECGGSSTCEHGLRDAHISQVKYINYRVGNSCLPCHNYSVGKVSARVKVVGPYGFKIARSSVSVSVYRVRLESSTEQMQTSYENRTTIPHTRRKNRRSPTHTSRMQADGGGGLSL